MTDDLDTLRPEVAQALGFIERNQKYGDGSVCAGDIDIIRAELLRLAADNCGMHKALCEHDELCEQLTAMRLRAEKSEAELAALKARIAEAPVVACPKTLVHAGNTMQTEFLKYTHERMPGGCNSWAGKRVRLVVEE